MLRDKRDRHRQRAFIEPLGEIFRFLERETSTDDRFAICDFRLHRRRAHEFIIDENRDGLLQVALRDVGKQFSALFIEFQENLRLADSGLKPTRTEIDIRALKIRPREFRRLVEHIGNIFRACLRDQNMARAHFLLIPLSFLFFLSDDVPPELRLDKIRIRCTDRKRCVKNNRIEFRHEHPALCKIKIAAVCRRAGIITGFPRDFFKILPVFDAHEKVLRLFLHALVEWRENLVDFFLRALFTEFQKRCFFDDIFRLLNILHTRKFHNEKIFRSRLRKLDQ